MRFRDFSDQNLVRECNSSFTTCRSFKLSIIILIMNLFIENKIFLFPACISCHDLSFLLSFNKIVLLK